MVRLSDERKLVFKELKAKALAEKVKAEARGEDDRIMVMDASGFDAVVREYWEMQRLEILQRRRLEHLANMACVFGGDRVTVGDHGLVGTPTAMVMIMEPGMLPAAM
jgi:hypothetical protein